jgi:phosphorylcholine metabolism protein LicD
MGINTNDNKAFRILSFAAAKILYFRNNIMVNQWLKPLDAFYTQNLRSYKK